MRSNLTVSTLLKTNWSCITRPFMHTSNLSTRANSTHATAATTTLLPITTLYTVSHNNMNVVVINTQFAANPNQIFAISSIYRLTCYLHKLAHFQMRLVFTTTAVTSAGKGCLRWQSDVLGIEQI